MHICTAKTMSVDTVTQQIWDVGGGEGVGQVAPSAGTQSAGDKHTMPSCSHSKQLHAESCVCACVYDAQLSTQNSGEPFQTAGQL